MLRAAGTDHRRLLHEDGGMFAVRRAVVDFRQPARLDDALSVETRVLACRGARLQLRQEIRKDGQLFVTIDVDLAFISPDLRHAALTCLARQGFSGHGLFAICGCLTALQPDDSTIRVSVCPSTQAVTWRSRLNLLSAPCCLSPLAVRTASLPIGRPRAFQPAPELLRHILTGQTPIERRPHQNDTRIRRPGTSEARRDCPPQKRLPRCPIRSAHRCSPMPCTARESSRSRSKPTSSSSSS